MATTTFEKPMGTEIETLKEQKVSKTDIVNNLTTNDATKPLSAAQGYSLNTKLPIELNLGYIPASAASKTFNYPTGLSRSNMAILGAALKINGDYYTNAVTVVLLSNDGIQCANSGGSGGDCILWYALK